LKFYYKKGKNAIQAAKKNYDVYRYDVVSSSCGTKLVQTLFQPGNFNVKDAPRSGITRKVDEIMEKVEQDQHINSHDIGKELNIDHKRVLNIDHKTIPSPSFREGSQKKHDVWMSHDLTVKNLIDRISICESLLKRNEIDF